jgi:hypothetical protein
MGFPAWMNVRTPKIRLEKPAIWLGISGSLSWERPEDFKVDLSWELKPRHTMATNESYSKFHVSGESWESILWVVWVEGSDWWFSLQKSELSSDRFNIAAMLLCVEALNISNSYNLSLNNNIICTQKRVSSVLWRDKSIVNVRNLNWCLCESVNEIITAYLAFYSVVHRTDSLNNPPPPTTATRSPCIRPEINKTLNHP